MTDEIPENYTTLDNAISLLEDSEAPFYEAVQLAKQAANDLKPLLANRMQYITAKRALRIIAAQPCEGAEFIPSSGVEDCNAAILACAITVEQRCWPCYARHVLAGGTP